VKELDQEIRDLEAIH
jgi:hypothetical protein